MEILSEYQQIEKALQKQSIIFVTGQAGTGKSTFIHYLQKKIKNLVALATTATAALNIQGVTIHSFFGFPASHITPEAFHTSSSIKIYPQKRKLMNLMEVLVVDEVSMLLPNLLDSMDIILQNINKNNQLFGGVKVVLVGDLLQLPPIVVTQQEKAYFSHRYSNAYFFAADVFRRCSLKSFLLTKVYRQVDTKFIRILEAIRINQNHKDAVRILNNLCYKDKQGKSLSQDAVYVVTTNAKAKSINKQKLYQLPDKIFCFEAKINGNETKEQWKIPASYLLELKRGAKVMFLKNNKPNWVNGDFGVVLSFEKNSIYVQKEDESVVEVKKTEWEKYKYTYDRQKKMIQKEVTGTFYQFPLALGWANTIHKTQGLTFEKVIVDLTNRAFCTGQTYVALSRCKNLENITLTTPISMTDVKTDSTAIDFLMTIFSSKFISTDLLKT